MGVNKVEFSGETLIDLTEDTVDASTLLVGETAHDKTGAKIVGTHNPNVVTGDLSVSGTISEAGTSLVDKYANRGETASLEIDGFVCPTINGIYNYVDSNNVYHRRIARVDLGSLSWGRAHWGSNYTFLAGLPQTTKSKDLHTPYNAYIQSKTCVGLGTTENGSETNIFSVRSDINAAEIKDDNYTDASAFKSAMQGVYLYYELETEQTEQYLNNYGLVNQVYNGTSHGGRNLFSGYDVMGNYVEMTGADSKYNGYYTIGSITSFHGAYQSDLVLQSGKQYTISAMVWSDNATTICCSEGDDYNFGNKSIVANTWTKMVWSATGHGLSKVMIENRGNGACHISQFMVEEGSTCHDYEPFILSNRQLSEIGKTTYFGTFNSTCREYGCLVCLVFNDCRPSELKTKLRELGIKSSFHCSAMQETSGHYTMARVSYNAVYSIPMSPPYPELDDTYYLYGTIVAFKG